MKRWLMVSVFSLLLAGCGGSKIKREPPAPLTDFTAERKVQEVWSVDIGASAVKSGAKLSVYFDGTAIYVSDRRGRVSGYAADNGHELWATRVGQSVTGATAAGSGLVVVATNKGHVIALDRNNGKQLWESVVSSEILAPAAIYSNVVVVQSLDGKVVGLAAADGKRLWVYERLEPALSLRGTAAPVIVGDVVLTGFASGKIAGIQLKDGKLLWELAVSQPRGRNEIERLVDVDVSPLAIGSVLYAASYQGKIIAVDMQTGRILWSRDVSTYSGMDADNKNVYLTDDHGNVVAFDQRTGASVWKQDQMRARNLNAPRYTDGFVAVGDFEGYVHWLSREDGHFVARYRVGRSPILTQPMASGNMLYVNDQSGTLSALRLEMN